MRKKSYLFLAIFIFMLLESTILNNFKLFNVKPDLLLISVIVFGLFLPTLWVVILSSFCGFLLDLFYFGKVGIYIIMFCALGIICRRIAKNLYIENNVVIMVLVFIATFSISFIRMAMTPQIPFWTTLHVCMLESLYTVLFFPFVFKVLSIPS